MKNVLISFDDDAEMTNTQYSNIFANSEHIYQKSRSIFGFWNHFQFQILGFY